MNMPENRSLGILLMLATMMCFVSLDAIMKYSLQTYSLVQVTWARFFFATVFAVLMCGKRLPRLAISHVPKLQLSRSILLMITTCLFNAGLMFLPLATATTIMFLSPILITILSIFFLGEHVGIRRWLGIAVGFVGAVIVVQPWHLGTAAFNSGVVFFLAAALTNANYQIITRKVRGDDPMTSLLYTAAGGAVFASLLLPFHWQWPDKMGWMLLVGSGFAGALGHMCLIQAMRRAEASVVAPFAYSSLVWATLLGYLIWKELPGLNVLGGALLIVSAGLYIFLRERVKKNGDVGQFLSPVHDKS